MRFRYFLENTSSWQQPMYTGVSHDYGNEFVLGKRNSNVDKTGVNNLGFFFTSNLDVAKYYARDGGVVKTVKLHVAKPLDIQTQEDFATGQEMNSILQQVGVKFVFDDEEDQEVWRFIDSGGTKLKNAITKVGYDGVSFKDSLGYKSFITYLVFNPKQISVVSSS